MPGSPDPFGVRIDHRNGVAHVRLQGELDLATAPILEEHLSAIEADGVRGAILDLRDMAFIDCTGLHALCAAWSRAADNGHRLAIVGATERARELFKLTDTERILDGPHAMPLLKAFTHNSSGRPQQSGQGKEAAGE
jgi:anti-sigma B factor antagonist